MFAAIWDDYSVILGIALVIAVLIGLGQFIGTAIGILLDHRRRDR